MADEQFLIDIVGDPSKLVTAATVAERSLNEVEQEANELKAALLQALSLRDAGTGASLDRIGDILEATQARAIVTDARISRIGKDIEAGSLRRFNQGLEETARRAGDVERLLKRAFAGVTLALITREFVQMSDTLTNVQNRIRLVTESSAELVATQQELFDIANRTRQSFEGTSTIFTRLAVSSKELGVNNQQLLRFTESLNQAIVLSGASSTEATNGLIQLSQGMAAGALRGDELRSVLEQLPAAADVIASHLGVTRGELRKLGEQGAITSRSIIDAFAAADASLDKRFATTVPTISQSFTVLQTKLIQLVGDFNETTGAAQKLADGLLIVAENALKIGSGDDAKALSKTFRDLEEDSKFVSTLAANLGAAQRELNNLARISQQQGGLSEAQAARVAELQARVASLRGEVELTTIAQQKQATQEIATAKAQKDQTAETLRQAKLLQEIKQPFEDYVQRHRDLQVLLAANKINQDEFNAALEKAKPPEPPKNEFVKTIDDLRELNEELEIQVKHQGLMEQALLIELDLRRQGIDISKDPEKQKQLAALLLQQKELNDALALEKKQRDDADKSAAEAERIAEAQQKRVDTLRARIDLNAELIQQEKDLLLLRAQEPDLIDEVDRALQDLRIRQLESSTALGDGFERAFLKIKAEAEDLASVGEDVVNIFADNATDALIEFSKTGQFAFKEFASAILEDLARVLARLLIVKAISAALGVISPAGEAAGQAASNFNAGRQFGGTVQPGQRPFPVGENGPELFVPNQTGTVVPNQRDQPQAPPQVNVQVVNLDDPRLVPQAINSGLADQAILNVMNRNKDAFRQMVQ